MTSGTPGDAPERDVAAFARALAEFTADLRGLDAKALTPADRTVLRWLFDELTALIDTALHDHATPPPTPPGGPPPAAS